MQWFFFMFSFLLHKDVCNNCFLYFLLWGALCKCKLLLFEKFIFDQEITGVVNLLDPEGRRHISFEDFCKGVAQINEVQHQGKWFHDFLLSSDSLLLPTSYAARIIIRQMYIAHFYRVDLMQFPRIRTSKYRF